MTQSTLDSQIPAGGQCFQHSQALQVKADRLIPGACHSINKGSDQYPELAPGFIVRGKGCHVWDADHNRFIEYGMGSRAVTLGHAYEPVLDAVIEHLHLGCNFSRPAAIEVACAEELLDVIDGAEMVKFAKNGSDVTSASVRLARAYTGRDMIAVCSDHPHISHDDWFMGISDMNAGIPQVVRDLTVTFHYNDPASLQALFDQYPGRIACVIMEPARTEEPVDDFLGRVCRICHDNGALFILDEIITGFRWHLGGGQKVYGVQPDLCTFGKALANGYSVSALAGKREFMRRGGFDHDRERIYFLSSTHGAETHALAAAMKTIQIYREQHVVETLHRQGDRLRKGVDAIAVRLGIQDYFQVIGRSCNLVYITRDPQHQPSQIYRTLFMQEIIRHGVLGPSFVVSISHTDDIIDQTIEAVGESLIVYKKALEDGAERYVTGRSIKPSMRRFN